jgi:hypothetical protein
LLPGLASVNQIGPLTSNKRACSPKPRIEQFVDAMFLEDVGRDERQFTRNPVALTLTIGDDTGTTSVSAAPYFSYDVHFASICVSAGKNGVRIVM